MYCAVRLIIRLLRRSNGNNAIYVNYGNYFIRRNAFSRSSDDKNYKYLNKYLLRK